jgi:hypothetical protein
MAGGFIMTKINKSGLQGLNGAKKAALKKMKGQSSSKIDFNKARDWYKNEQSRLQ